jgi:hypothetical protein
MARPLTDQLRAIGIRQESDPILRQLTVPFDLPQEATEATMVRGRLLDCVDELRRIYPFTKGVGIAAMAVISPPGEHMTMLVNPGWSSPEDVSFYARTATQTADREARTGA